MMATVGLRHTSHILPFRHPYRKKWHTHIPFQSQYLPTLARMWEVVCILRRSSLTIQAHMGVTAISRATAEMILSNIHTPSHNSILTTLACIPTRLQEVTTIYHSTMHANLCPRNLACRMLSAGPIRSLMPFASSNSKPIYPTIYPIITAFACLPRLYHRTAAHQPGVPLHRTEAVIVV